MNFLLKTAIKGVIIGGICIYSNHKRKTASKTAYQTVGKKMQAARRKHKFIDGPAEYKRQRFIEQKKVNRAEKIKRFIKNF